MDMALLDGLGRRPIDDQLPAGSDVREDPRFDTLQREIGKLSNPGADGQTDWQRVGQLASLLLAEKGKDLLIASYLNAALVNALGLPGLAIGLEVIADMLEHFWDGMSPPVTRLRARRNAIQWLLDRSELNAAEQQWSELAPQPSKLIEGVLASARRIDEQLRARDAEAPSMRSLQALIDRVAVVEEAPAAPEVAPTVQTAPTGTATMPAAPAAHVAPAIAPLPSAPIAGDVTTALTQSLGHLNQVADAMLSANLCDARAYRTSRFANWAGLEALPPATAGLTLIGAPIGSVVDALQRMQQEAVEPQDAIGFAEAQLPAFPFWLDLQVLCIDGLARLGEAGAAARADVERATRDLLARLPGLESLSFANGMSFANARTLEWIGTLAAPAGAAGGGVPRGRDDALATASAQARSLAANGELEAAVALLQQRIDQAGDASKRLGAQIRLCELLITHREGRVPVPFAQVIVEQIRRHDLDRWDPELAIEGWVAAHGVLSQDDAHPAERDAALSAIARLDAARAVALTR